MIKQNVSGIRKARGLTKAHVARYVHVDRSYLTRLENGTLQPSGEAMLRFARYFKCPVEHLFQLQEDAK